MKNIVIIICLLLISSLNAQDKDISEIEFLFGRNRHGSGDIPGYYFGTAYNQALSEKWYWTIGFEGTLNDTPDFLLTYEFEGTEFDASLHNVTAGFQLVSGIGFKIVKLPRQQFTLSFLPLLRYQATSLSDRYNTIFPSGSGLPIPVRDITRLNPGRTFAIGASIRLGYKYNLTNDFYLGLNGAFQTDTNGDTIPSYFFTIGKKFN